MDGHLDTFKRIENNDVHAFELIFKEYYKFLCSYAFGLLKEKHTSEEIVEEFFIEVWNNRRKIKITSSVRSYFVGSIHNRCLNYIQREKPKFLSALDISDLKDNEGAINEQLIVLEVPSLLTNELENTVAKAIENLPQGCREVFLLSRFKHLNYEQIAEKQGITVNTVKTQIKIALRKLKENLSDYLTVFLLLLLK
jgi:RNA polymerase sigma-70 factor, ECF subfamily